MTPPQTETLLLSLREGVLHVTLNRPERKNALNRRMLGELVEVFGWADAEPGLRAVVLRGAGGTFCAGADLKDLARSGAGGAAPDDPRAAAAANNRRFGTLTAAAGAMGVPLVGVIEGAVMGGGFGLACVTDVALCHRDAKFALPETGLGLVPAQIAPFVVQRIGLTQARRLMLTGARLDGTQACALGIVHEVYDDVAALDAGLRHTLGQIHRCAPAANAGTKRLLQKIAAEGPGQLDELLDHAAGVFADAALGDEGREGAMAFIEKRKPEWAK